MPRDHRDPTYQHGVPRELILAIKTGAEHGVSTRDMARQFALSVSTVHKIRQGYYDHRLESDYAADARHPARVWCPGCRHFINPPCVLCDVAGYQRRQAKSPRTRRPRIAPCEVGNPHLRRRLDLPVGAIGLWTRVANTLELYGYFTVAQVLAASPDELQKLPNIGAGTVKHIRQVIHRLGFYNSPNRPQPSRTKQAA